MVVYSRGPSPSETDAFTRLDLLPQLRQLSPERRRGLYGDILSEAGIEQPIDPHAAGNEVIRRMTLEELRELYDKAGELLIADEVVNG